MKSLYIIIGLVLFTFTYTSAQDSAAIVDLTKVWRVDWEPYLIGGKPKVKVGDSINVLGKLLSYQFTNVITGQPSNTLGNFASVTPTDGKIDFAGSLLFTDRVVITLKASGRATDGIVAIFDNNKLNTQISIETKIHILSLRKFSLSFDSDSAFALDEKVRTMMYEHEKARLEIIASRDAVELMKKNAILKAEVDSLKLLDTSGLPASARNDLYYEIAKRTLKQDSIAKALSTQRLPIAKLRNLHNKTIQELDKLTFTASEGFNIQWWTFGYKVNNNDFSYFNPKATFDSQVMDTNFVSHEGNIQWSLYNWSLHSFKTLFLGLGASVAIADNFSSLKKREISETTNYGPTTGARSVTRKFDSYEGTYERNIASGKFYADMYWFCFNKNIAALHLNPEWWMREKEKPVGNLFVGVMLSIPKKDTPGSVVNAELYYQFLDLFKETDTEYRLFERNSIGIRFTFPINFKYK